MITTGGNLKARYVIHTVGPVWHGGSKGEARLLESAYRESLELASGNNLSSVSFPSISTGVYSYPVEEASRIALKTVISFLRKDSSIRKVVFVLFNSRAFEAFSSSLGELTGEKR